ncbi:MAG: sulfurtransferase [Ignavibacteria bacterium]
MNSNKKTRRIAGFLHTLNFYKHFFLFAAAVFLLQPQALIAEEGIKGNLVSVNWLEKNLKKAGLLLLDVSPAQVYAAQHIPGAVSVHLFSYGINEMPAAQMEELYSLWGISDGKKIVIYDQGGSMNATRFFFNLYYHGFPAKQIFILDGGLSKWQQAGLPVTKESTPAPNNGSFRIAKYEEDIRARLPEFLTASGDPENNILIEALGADWHFGEVAVFDRSGHIPNGILLPSTDFFNADKTFKSPEEIGKMLSYLGIKSSQQIYTYCGGGVAASVPFFALKFIMDYSKVKLYIESEMGWLQDERRLPYWTYDAPFLMRDTKWLQFWGGKMLRMYLGEQVSILDVRTADAFSQGHVPFALNIPADLFKKNINDTEKLAEILGSAGINASHEAVVISGAGLTKESALVFVMLEKLGQKKVSVFIDSLHRWAELGFPLTKDSTLIGPKKDPMDLSIPPVNYSGDFRENVIITDLKSTKGLYPKVLIASGKSVPAKTYDNNVVHIPYTHLLNDDGAPKAAKDIWNILVKAGVSRYSELVCFSDDPAEAAANYFILRLMGYPDIKVLVI